jgi:hypothetical protein
MRTCRLAAMCAGFAVLMVTGVQDSPAQPAADARSYELVFSTYLGGSSWDMCRGMCVDSEGNITITGGTASTDFPTTSGAYSRKYGRGNCDVIVAKFSPAGSLLAATFVGGSGFECNGPDTVFVDGKDNVLIVGFSDSTDYPVTGGAFQARNAGQFDACISILSNDLSRLLYSTYMGGGNNDNLRAACIGAASPGSGQTV